MSNRACFIQTLLLLALPFGAFAQASFVEKGPRDLKSYLDAGETPRYIRIDVSGYNIRKTPDFSVNNQSNVDFKSEGGQPYAVESVKRGYYGAAVQIHVNDTLRWVYVPYNRKNDFQFCESDACFMAMARSLDYLLKGTGVSVEAAQNCGVMAGEDGLVFPEGTAARARTEPASFLAASLDEQSVSEPVTMPAAPAPRAAPPTYVAPRNSLPAHSAPAHTASVHSAPPRTVPAYSPPAYESPQLSTPVPAGTFRMRVKPLWENAKGAQGENWTALMSNALDKYGQDLIHQRSLSDAATFCPRFSQLSSDDKKEFWVHLFNGIARYESNFKLGAPVFDEVRGIDVYRGPLNAANDSMGLFQISYGASAYGRGCQMNLARDRNKDVSDPSLTIYDPKIQMECAVTVMNHWVAHDGGVGLSSHRGGARFWSTLRSSNPATRQVIASLHRDTACFK